MGVEFPYKIYHSIVPFIWRKKNDNNIFTIIIASTHCYFEKKLSIIIDLLSALFQEYFKMILIFWYLFVLLNISRLHCRNIVQLFINSTKVYKTKRFHKTNYTVWQNIVNNKTVNNSIIWFHKKYNCPRMWRRTQHITKLRILS